MRVRGFAIVLVLAAALPGAARADDLSVMDRPRPEYDAKGIPLGGFRLKPALDVSVAADDNVFRTPAPTARDVFVTLRGAIDVRSDWGRHEIDLSAGIVREQYVDHQEANETDWNVGASGRLDAARGTAFNGAGSYAVLHEPRSSPDQPGGARNATRYAQLHGEVSIVHDPALIAVSEGGSFDRNVYDPTRLIGGSVFDNSDRNHDAYQGYFKAAYKPSPDYSVFLRGSYGGQTYDRKIDRNGFNRQQQGFHGDAGADVHFTHLLEGEVFAGYVNDRFHAPLKSVAAVEYGAALNWYATPLLTAHLTASRLFNDTTLAGASVSDDQMLGAGLDYEFLRNLIVQTHFSITGSHFVGIARTDSIWEGDIGARYLIDRNISADAGYTFSHRSSSAPGQGFDDNLATAGLHFQL